MKRGMFGRAAILAAAMALGLSGCSSPRPREAREAESANGWKRPPMIASVRRAQASLIFTGTAEPGARVVLRNDEGVAYAAVADPDGKFEIRMAAPQGALLLRPEIQMGQDAAPSPDRLLIVAGGAGPIAVLRAGGPTRRLDAAPMLGAVDSDDRSLLASGQVRTTGGRIEIAVAGESMPVETDGEGRWSLMLGSAGPGEAIRVAGREFVWPGPGSPGPDLQVERAGAGWRVGWVGSAGARQWTWLPDAAPAA
ncbi:Ig-like domain-containing protein [Brevundimonas lenta]|uniref:Bacterial Ig domain-containing protein n=1 Tax=Brevundimonas lenta TaxID=424796 RepID=A0A7W6JF97_9CAUL|nr:Ig-like domain-containing protein [Brevundimonas lenta]MBB4083052.1 hypothetical protein [Brevundimonas lenta]